MVIKILGACIIIFVCTYTGFQLSSDLSSRVKLLAAWHNTLIEMENYISALQMPLNEIYIRLSRGELENFFAGLSSRGGESTAEAWKKELKKLKYLDCEDKLILENLSLTLGASDMQTQLSNISLAAQDIKTRLEAAAEKSKTDSKLYRTVSFFAGIGISIILL